MRVLITTVDLNMPGGVAQYYAALRPHFDQNVEYFTVGAREDGRSIPATVRRMGKDYWNFYRRLKEGGFDVVHLNPSLGRKAIVRDAGFLLLAKSLNIKTVLFIHGWDKAFARSVVDKLAPLFRAVFSRADLVVVLAEEFKRRLIDWGVTVPIVVESTNVDDDYFTHYEPKKPPVRRGKGGAGEFNILFLSRLVKEKGVHEAIDAFALLKSRHPHLTLTVAGDGAELPRAKAHASALKLTDVEFPGFLRGSAKLQAFRRASVYVFPTYGEGLPISVLEAMALGLPVVTRPVGGLADFFEDGKMGFLTESMAPADFAALLERLIVDPQTVARISRYNHDYAKERFAASQVAGRLLGYYRATLGGRV